MQGIFIKISNFKHFFEKFINRKLNPHKRYQTPQKIKKQSQKFKNTKSRQFPSNFIQTVTINVRIFQIPTSEITFVKFLPQI